MIPLRQLLPTLLLGTAAAGLAQSLQGGLYATSCCDHPFCRHYGYPCNDHYTVRVIDYPPKPDSQLETPKKMPSPDPLQARLEKRLDAIDSTGFINTNTTPIHIAPGLAPKN